MKPYYSASEQYPEELFCNELEERLETVSLPTGEIMENCCTKIFNPCLCVCDCNSDDPAPVEL